ncbi:MAG: hypothetical protein HY753_00270, partial [Nitrospirae bacterium]|nr:hypothetical protein [Nitrospirota bacterium]
MTVRRRLTLLQRFSILSILSLSFISIVMGRVITHTLEQYRLYNAKQITANIVSDEVKKGFQAAELSTPKIADYDVFSEKVKHLTLGPDVERIKIWNKDKVVVWSDDKQLVGQKFLDNEELNESLSGEITSEI